MDRPAEMDDAAPAVVRYVSDLSAAALADRARIAELEARLAALVAGSILPADAVDEFTIDGVRWVRVPAERRVKFI